MNNEQVAKMNNEQKFPFEKWKCARAQVGDVNMFYRTAGSGPPLVLLHGFPQHSLMWHTIGPLLAEHFTVIAPDQRGVGNSSIMPGGYDGTTMAADLKGLLDELDVKRAFVVGYDLGSRVAASFARDCPDRVEKVACIEFVLPGFGYEQAMNPTPDWTNYNANWHLGLFTLPDMAEFLFRGKEREMLTWWFYHIAYSANAKISSDHFEAYWRELTKPGALIAGIKYYAAVWQDAEDNKALQQHPLTVPLLAMAGEASIGPFLEQSWKPVGTDVTLKVIPEAGHWISDENPEFTAAALIEFFSATPH